MKMEEGDGICKEREQNWMSKKEIKLQGTLLILAEMSKSSTDWTTCFETVAKVGCSWDFYMESFQIPLQTAS